MYRHHCLSNDLSRHASFDFNAFHPHLPEAVNIGFALDDDVSRADTAGNFT